MSKRPNSLNFLFLNWNLAWDMLNIFSLWGMWQSTQETSAYEKKGSSSWSVRDNGMLVIVWAMSINSTQFFFVCFLLKASHVLLYLLSLVGNKNVEYTFFFKLHLNSNCLMHIRTLSDVGFASVCRKYLLLPLDKKESASAYYRAE